MPLVRGGSKGWPKVLRNVGSVQRWGLSHTSESVNGRAFLEINLEVGLSDRMVRWTRKLNEIGKRLKRG